MKRGDNMIVEISDRSIFDMAETEKDAVVITTNGIVKSNGHAVMGKGIALEANNIFHISKRLGYLLSTSENQVYDFGVHFYADKRMRVITFPTKHHWACPSDIRLIHQSTNELMAMINHLDINRVFMPPPGCGNGGLNWEFQVKPFLDKWLDNRFIVVVRENQIRR